jgi:ferredoxin/rubrerythrin
VRVDGSRCTRCGACAALCRPVFDVNAGACRVARQPDALERVLAEAARWVCPTDAIRAVAGDGGEAGDDGEDVGHREGPAGEESRAGGASGEGDSPLFTDLATGSERVRWTLDAVPWHELDVAQASPALCIVVREMAFSENATYSATQRFLEAFCDDVDFSRWVAVWFYEETRHPYVLTEWLRRVGEGLPAEFVSKGRVSTPFMRSLTGTLVTNVISEITAAQAYRRLGARSPEPLLRQLAVRIAGDEARHAASFFRFGRKRLEEAPAAEAQRDRARGLEVLQAWLGGATPATHPVAQMLERLGEAAGEGSIDLDVRGIRTRVVRVVGLLLDVPLRAEEDVGPALRNMLARGRDAG